ALLAAALDQVACEVTGGRVSAARNNPSADLMCAWLEARLGVEIEHTTSRGPGLTEVRLSTTDGDVAVRRQGNGSGVFVVPGHKDRPVALHRRTVAECLAEDLRRLDEDDIYAQTVRYLLARAERIEKRADKPGTRSRSAARKRTTSRKATS